MAFFGGLGFGIGPRRSAEEVARIILWRVNSDRRFRYCQIIEGPMYDEFKRRWCVKVLCQGGPINIYGDMLCVVYDLEYDDVSDKITKWQKVQTYRC